MTTEVAVLPVPAEIATLPPVQPEHATGDPRSERTGEPRRPPLLIAAIVLGWLSVAMTIAAFVLWWWDAASITAFHTSALLLYWTKPDPVSALAIVMVILISLIALLMVTAAGTFAYNAWAGQRWIRLGGLVCLAVTGLSFLLNPGFSLAMIPLAVAVILLWLPPVKKFLVAMVDFRTPRSVVVPTTDIRYGPQPLIGRRG
jgi:magnesium-transporting ATPase (P-type)